MAVPTTSLVLPQFSILDINLDTNILLDLAPTIPIDDFGNEVGGTNEFLQENVISGEIEYTHDEDWIPIFLVSGGNYTFDIEGAETGKGSLSDPVLSGIYNSSGAYQEGSFDNDSGQGLNAHQTYVPFGGIYYVAVKSSDNELGSYTLSYEREDDYGGDIANAGQLRESGSSGTIEVLRESDMLAVYLSKDITYTFDLEGASTEQGTLFDPTLSLFDSSGTFLDMNDNGGTGLNARLYFTPDINGYYYISVSSSQQNLIGSYSLSYNTDNTVRGDDYDNTHDNADYGSLNLDWDFEGDIGWIHSDRGAEGVIETITDTDLFRFKNSDASVTRVTLEARESGIGALSNPVIKGLYSWNGSSLEYQLIESDSQRVVIEFERQSSGNQYIEVASDNEKTGGYALSFQSVSIDDYGSSIESPEKGWISQDFGAYGEIESAYDTDIFILTASNAGQIKFVVTPRDSGSGSLQTPIIKSIYDIEGNTLAFSLVDDESTNSPAYVVSGSIGGVYVEVAAEGSGTGGYHITSQTFETFSGNYDDYEVRQTDEGIAIEANDNPGTVFVVDWTDRITFSDFSLALDIDGTAGYVYQLYDAAFDRAPDTVGLGYWIHAVDGGENLKQVAESFVTSEEFSELYGSDLSNEQYLETLYENIRGDVPDSAGFQWWLDKLDTGEHSKASALVGFSESAEHQDTLSGLVSTGVLFDVWLG